MTSITFNGSAEGLRQALEELDRQGYDLHTLYVENRQGVLFEDVTVTEHTLTDGSTVYNAVLT